MVLYAPRDPDWFSRVNEIYKNNTNCQKLVQQLKDNTMSDRFYMQQGLTKSDFPLKPVKKLKADWIKDINNLLPNPVNGLDKLTLASLEELYSNIKSLK